MILPAKTTIIVTPVYEDIDAFSRLLKELAIQFGTGIFIIAVDDASINEPLAISSIESELLDGVILRLWRNVGHQKAISIGLWYASQITEVGHSIIVMDSDGEDIPSTIHNLLKALEPQNIDIVVAQRKSRVETTQFKLFYSAYKIIFLLLTGRRINFGNFAALKHSSVKRLVAMQELSIHIAGAVLASKLRIGVCPIDRGARYAGKSKMNFVGLALHGFKALMVFAEDVLIRVGVACVFIGIISLVCVAIAIVLKLIGFSTPGWFSVALGILILMLLQTGALALMILMMTGLVKSRSIASGVSYEEFIEKILKSRYSA